MWYIGSDNLVQIVGLYNVLTGAYVNTATIVGQLYDSADTAVDDPITFTADGAGTGNYNGTLPATVTAELTEGAYYYLEITITSGDNQLIVRYNRKASYKGG